MKLRIKGNSLRLRLTRSEVRNLRIEGRVTDTIVFGPSPEARLAYAVEHSALADSISCCYTPQNITILIPAKVVEHWAEGDMVSLHASHDTGSGTLDLLIEKDFSCLDRSLAENEDTFPNPHAQGCGVV